MTYGSAKSSSGSTPSESSGRSSAPDESSSGSVGMPGGSSSGQSGSSSLGGSSSSGFCSFFIHDVLYVADDVMTFSVTNDGTEVLEITAITGVVGLTPDTPLPIFLVAGASITITVTSDPPGNDLRGTPFTVSTSCGDASETFPLS